MCAIALAIAFVLHPHSAKAATYTVTTTDDAGAGSLRQAIIDANGSVGADTIAFSIAGAGVHTITPATVLPAITDTVTIDGSTQPGASCDPRILLIEINGENLDTQVGLQLTDGSSNSIIKGLVINRVPNSSEDPGGLGIIINGDSGSDTIVCNYIGTNAAGDSALPNYAGIGFLLGTGVGNIVGGSTVAERNVISGNSFTAIFGQQFSDATIKGNYIGPTADGMASLGNGFIGGLYFASSSNLTIGGGSSGEGNVITAPIDSSNYGIVNSGGSNSVIQGNFIGLNPTGDATLGGDILYGLAIFDVSNITIGGTANGTGNVISAAYGIYAGLADSVVQGNKIGTNSAGTACTAGQTYPHITGMYLESSINNIIGGATAAARNLVSCQKSLDGGGTGIAASQGFENNTIQGNYIGTNGGGQVLSGFGNEGDGILIEQQINGAPTNNLIGGNGAGEGNVIAGNGGAGVNLNGPVVDPDNPDLNQPLNNSILGNSIYGNGGLGINLSIAGDTAVTPNDAGDPDFGPNHLMNFPVIQSVTSTNGSATITYDLDINDSEPGATGYRVEFFANDSADPSGHGQGQTYLGSDTVSGDVTGRQATITLPNDVDGSKYITATTTMTTGINVGPNEVQVQDTPSGFGHTSEFAADVQATLIPTPTPGPTPAPAPAGNSSSLADTGQAQHKGNTLLTSVILIIAGAFGLAIIGGNMFYSKCKQ